MNTAPTETSEVTIEDVRDFIANCEERKQDWQILAERSWAEWKKRNPRNRMLGGRDVFTLAKRMRYPLWWICYQVRKPIVLSRLPIPVVKDTQGDDPYGRTACVIGERLARSILKTFDALPVFSSGVDDFLLTNLGWCRGFYKCEEHDEPEKIRLQELQQPPPPPAAEGAPPPQPQAPIYVTDNGQPVQSPEFDDIGPYVLSGNTIKVLDEQVYLDHGLYTDIFLDPDARRWSQVKKLAFRYEYTYRDFKAKFGSAALEQLTETDIVEHKDGRPIVVFEYWDYFTRQVKWLAENSQDFFQPMDMDATYTQAVSEQDTAALEAVDPKDATDQSDQARADSSDIYKLEDFFPCAAPLIINAATDEIYPTPEFFQVREILDDVNQIANRMFLLTKAIRVRFLFDGSVPALASLITESGEGGGLAVPNLAKALMNGSGSIENLVAYFPVAEMVEGLQNMYTAFQQRLDMFFQATGQNDLIRGVASEQSDKTFGERQMEGKYALNRIEPYQRQTQEWIKSNYQLLMEMALKNFSNESLDEYITPQTLDPEDRQRYSAALALLKSNRRRRFRVDFETDSTIAINEQYQKKQAIDFANMATKSMESIAKTSETWPDLAAAELQILKHIVEQYSDGKLFLDEITNSLDEMIEKAKAPKPPEPNVDQEKIALERQKLDIMSQLEVAKLQQKNREMSFAQQLEQIKIAVQQNRDQADTEAMIVKLQSEIALAQEDLQLRREEMMIGAQQEGGKQSVEAFRAQIDARVAAQEMTLAQAQQQLEEYRVKIEAQDAHLSLAERVMTERRLQDEQKLTKEAHVADSIAKLADVAADPTPEAPKQGPVTIDLSKTVHIKPPAEKPKGKRAAKERPKK